MEQSKGPITYYGNIEPSVNPGLHKHSAAIQGSTLCEGGVVRQLMPARHLLVRMRAFYSRIWYDRNTRYKAPLHLLMRRRLGEPITNYANSCSLQGQGRLKIRDEPSYGGNELGEALPRANEHSRSQMMVWPNWEDASQAECAWLR